MFKKRSIGFILTMTVPLLFLIITSCVTSSGPPSKRLTRRSPIAADAFSQGKMRYESGDYDSALTFFLNATKEDPAYWLPYNWLAWTYFNLQRYDDAIAQFNISNNLKEVASNYQGLGESYAKIMNFDAALKNYQKFAKLDPKNFIPYNRLGWAYVNLKRYDDAIVQFNIANNFKQVSGNYQGLGEAYSGKGDFNTALNHYQKYAALEPENFYPYNRLGWTYFNLQRYREAVVQFNIANNFKHVSGNDWGLGESYSQLEDYKNANAAFASALKAAANDYEKEQLKISWVNSLVARGAYQKAFELLGPKPYIGIKIGQEQDGIKILGVIKGSPADIAGLNSGDILTHFDGKGLAGVATRTFLQEMVGETKYGAEINVKVKREGRYLSKNVTVGIRPSVVEAENAQVQTTDLPERTILKTGAYWAVIIGISNYQDTRIPSLRYASSDAQTFYDWIISAEGGRYAPSRVKLLIDEDATGENIKKALFEWLREALDEDMVVIYFAGHGSPESPDSPSNLFLLPYDTQYNSIATTGFPMWDIETALKRYIKAKKVVVIADACHSGGVGQSFDISRRANRGLKVNPISSGIQDLAQVSDGVCIISASSDNQFSQESEKWGGGRGVFTHFLIEGLKGQADYNKNRSVSLGELTSFLSERVRRETRNAQSPNVSGRYDPALSIGK